MYKNLLLFSTLLFFLSLPIALPAVQVQDTSNPTVTIMEPTTDSNYDPPGTPSVINLAGTASDEEGIASIVWTNNRGGDGTAVGTTDWAIPDLELFCGEDNIITVTVEDSDGYTASDSIRVNVEPCKTKGISIN